jgi:hypothetical protein
MRLARTAVLLSCAAAAPFDSRNISAEEWDCTGVPVLNFGGESVRCGSEVLLAQSQFRPTFLYYDADPEAFYTLIVVDRDATSAAAPTRSPLLHFATPHIPGSQLHGRGLGPDVLLPGSFFNFSGPHPPSGSGCHRYYAMLYLEDPSVYPVLALNESYSSYRFNFDFQSWCASQNFQKVGVNLWVTQAADTRQQACNAGPESEDGGVDPVGIAAGTAAGVLLLATVSVSYYRQRRRAGKQRNAAKGNTLAGGAAAGDYEQLEWAEWT